MNRFFPLLPLVNFLPCRHLIGRRKKSAKDLCAIGGFQNIIFCVTGGFFVSVSWIEIAALGALKSVS